MGWEWSNHFWAGSWSDSVDKWMLELWRVMVLLQWMHVHISILNTSLISGIYNVEGNLRDVNWSNFFCKIFLFLVVYIAEVAVNLVSSNYIPFMFCMPIVTYISFWFPDFWSSRSFSFPEFYLSFSSYRYYRLTMISAIFLLYSHNILYFNTNIWCL